MPNPTSAEEWEAMAREELATAEDLARLRRWKAAFYHGGMAVEFGLKCRIMRVQRLNRWPDRGPFHTHSLSDLVGHADLTQRLLEEVANVTSVGIAWSAAKDWSIGTRYDARPFPPRRGSDMVEAVGSRGLLEWLLKV